MKVSQPKILFCPAHYVFDGVSRGSELSWAYAIADAASQHYPESEVVTGFAQLNHKKPYPVIELQKNKKTIDLSLKNSLIFNFKYSLYGAFRAQNTFTIHHHLLPFMIGTTFNIFWALGLKRFEKTIIGPLQMPIPQYQDNVHDFNRQHIPKLTQFFTQRVLSFFSGLLFFLSRRTLRSADKVVAIDDRTKKALLELGIPEQSIVLIPPGIDTEKFKPSAKKKRSSLLRLITVSYLIERKRVELLLHGMAQAVTKNPKIHLTILGTGPQEQQLKKLTHQLGIIDHITFVGFVPNSEMPQHYQAADAFITASAYESWGQMYLEAMASGLPVISTKNHGAQTILNNAFSKLVEPSPTALSNAILAFVKDSDKMMEMSKNARDTATQKYDWKKVIIPRYFNLYSSLISS